MDNTDIKSSIRENPFEITGVFRLSPIPWQTKSAAGGRLGGSPAGAGDGGRAGQETSDRTESRRVTWITFLALL